MTLILLFFNLQHHSKRLIIFGWWIFAILVFASYAVTLAPLMASRNKAMFKYDSIDAMLQDPDFKFKTYPNGSTHSLLKVQ